MEFCRSIAELLEAIVLDVGSYAHVSYEAIGRKPVRWLFHTYELIQRRRYNQALTRIVETEIAVGRAIAIQFAPKGHELPPLPTYEEIVAERQREVEPPRKPSWMLKYEEVNRSRLLSRGGQAQPGEEKAEGRE